MGAGHQTTQTLRISDSVKVWDGDEREGEVLVWKWVELEVPILD